jgi:hypothetical protein
MATELTTDYLVVGSGAVGMAFADVLVSETDADIVIVDRFAKPGGHWNVAYPFVTLHQPSQFYGVSSVELSKGVVDQVGLNKGLGDLATGAEVSAYFDNVMRHQLLPSGRVRYYPMSDYRGDGYFVHKLTGERFHVNRTKTVDCTYLNTSVPSTHTPSFEVSDEVRFMPLNDLPSLAEPPSGYVVVGGGKTGIDAILWLLEQRVDPDVITWIKSRDAWLLNRKNTQPSAEFFEYTLGSQAAQFESIANATSVEDMFLRLEESGYFLRLDPDVWPTMFHGATISELELAQLRRITNVVRLGRVQSISTTEIVLDHGTIPTTPDHLFVDCSASAITNLEMKPVFEDDLITPQTVRSYQPVFSAALIAHVEVTRDTEEEKNALCAVVPLPNSNLDYLKLTLAFMTNQYNWGQDSELREWLLKNRLDGFSKMVSEVDEGDEAKRAILRRLRDSAMPAAVRLTELIAEAELVDS